MAKVGKPAKSGFYWYKAKAKGKQWEPVEVTLENGKPWADLPYRGYYLVSDLDGEWGPEIIPPS